MRLYFFRHGQAESGIVDFDRELTDEGRARTRHSAAFIRALDAVPTRIFSSPLVRARQTAGILAEVLGLEVEVREEVAPGFNQASVVKLIEGMADPQSAMFVGHEPDMSSTVQQLIGGGSVVMKKGGLARVDMVVRDPLRAELVWLVAPKVFDAAAG